MSINNKVLVIIPARGGSKGVKRKNIKLLNDKPLISYTIDAAKNSQWVDRVIVSTEDLEIEKISKKYGAEVPFLRPQYLAQDDTPTIEAIIHSINWLEENENYKPEYICLLQCTSPFRDSTDIDELINKTINGNFDGGVSVCEAKTNPYWTNVFEGEKLKYFLEEGKQITRRQDLPKVYTLNGSIYIAKTELILRYKTMEMENSTGYIMDFEKSIDIDTEFDFKMAELIMKERTKND